MIIDELLAYAEPLAEEASIRELCFGLGYTGVLLSDGRSGLCYTFRNDLGRGCGVVPGAGKLQGMPVSQALSWAKKKNPAQAALGIATLNALCNQRFPQGENVVQAVQCRETDRVGMVGDFCPLRGKFQKEAAAVYVFEREPLLPGFFPEEQEQELLPLCDLVILSSTTLITGKIDDILAACTKAREIVLVGASTPMAPEIWEKYGVTALAGTGVEDGATALRILAQGGGAMDLSPVSRKLFHRMR